MGRHFNGHGHQAGHERCTVAALISRYTAETIPMTVVLDAPPSNVIEPDADAWSDWIPTHTWLAQRGHTAQLAVTA